MTDEGNEIIGNIITQICVDEELASQGLMFPRLEFAPDLTDFQQQPSDLFGVNQEWVKQSGDDEHGFRGTLAFKLPNEVMMMIDFYD